MFNIKHYSLTGLNQFKSSFFLITVCYFWVGVLVLLSLIGPASALCQAAAAASEDLVLFLLYVIGLQGLFR